MTTTIVHACAGEYICNKKDCHNQNDRNRCKLASHKEKIIWVKGMADWHMRCTSYKKHG